MRRQIRKSIAKTSVRDCTRQIHLNGMVSCFKKAYKMGYILVAFLENIFCPGDSDMKSFFVFMVVYYYFVGALGQNSKILIFFLGTWLPSPVPNFPFSPTSYGPVTK